MCGLIVYFNLCLRIYDSRGTLLTPRELGITRFRHCGSSRGSQSAESPADERETGQTGRPGSFPNCPQEGGNGERNANESVGEGGGGGWAREGEKNAVRFVFKSSKDGVSMAGRSSAGTRANPPNSGNLCRRRHPPSPGLIRKFE